MIVRGPRPEGNFYILDKSISEDKRLSWAARGMLVFLLGKPNHWQVSPAALVNETADSAKPLGRDGVYALLQELHHVGYIVRTQERRGDGSMGAVQYTVSERCEPLTEKPEAVSPHTGLPDTADPSQASIDFKARTKKKKESVRVTFDREAGKFNAIPESLIAMWREAHPAINVDTEITRAAIWLISNPANDKSNYLRFITNWLGRARPIAVDPNGQRRMTRLEQAAHDGAILSGKHRQQPTGAGDVFDVDAREINF